MSNFDSRIDEITEVLTLPDVIIKINKLVSDPDTSASDITKLISNDIGLSTRILKLVNSPFYGFSKQITSINYAIVILGFNAVRNLAFTAFLMDMKQSYSAEFDAKGFWKFAITSGAVAEFIAGRSGLQRNDDTYISGLLHDIGVVILNQYFEDEFNKASKYSIENNCTLLQAEREVLDFDHIEISQRILDSWNFPAKILQVCKFYPTPDECPDDHLPSLVHVADIFCRALCLGNPADNSIPQISEFAMEKLKINSSDFHTILKEIMDNPKISSDFL